MWFGTQLGNKSVQKPLVQYTYIHPPWNLLWGKKSHSIMASCEYRD